MHAVKLKAVIDAESEQMREIRTMRFIRAFRVHAQKKADQDKSNDVLLLERVTKILGAYSGEYGYITKATICT